MARAEATLADSTGVPYMTAPAMLEDLSSRGACVRLKQPISVGSKITIKWRREEFSGTVRHCKKVASDYLVGILRDAQE